MRRSATELDKGEAAIDDAISALKQFDAKGDLKAQYANYSAKLTALDKQVSLLHDLRADLKKKEEEYVASWETRQATIQNEDLRKKSEERKKALTARLEALSGKADSTRSGFDSMMKGFRDIQNFLEHDLNESGLSSVSKLSKDTTKEAVSVKEGIESIRAELVKIADEIDAPAPPSAEPSKTG